MPSTPSPHSALPLVWQRHPGSEAWNSRRCRWSSCPTPHLERPVGYFAPEDAASRPARASRGRDHHARAHGIGRCLPALDLHRSGRGRCHRARRQPGFASAAASSQGIDWSGLEQERVARWYRQLHIFLYPFYYIEYGIAQLGALQVWRNSLRDPVDAVRRYRDALALGNTRPLPDIYAAAGARLAFDGETIGELVQLVEDQVDRLRAEVPAAT